MKRYAFRLDCSNSYGIVMANGKKNSGNHGTNKGLNEWRYAVLVAPLESRLRPTMPATSNSHGKVWVIAEGRSPEAFMTV